MTAEMDEKRNSKAAAAGHRNFTRGSVKSLSEEFRESEARYFGIVENMQEMVCRFLPDGTVTFSNRAFKTYIGGETGKFTGSNFFQWISTNNEEHKVMDDFKACIEKTTFMPYPTKAIRCDGSERWIRWAGHSLFDDRGSLMEYQAVGRDITDIKDHQEYKIKQEQWRRRIQKLEAIGTLSAGIAHDFNNITAVILGNVQLAMDDVKKGTRTRKNLDEIFNSCLRARDMIKQILTFAREGDQELMSLSLVPVVKESIKFLKSAIPSTIEIRGNVHEVDYVKADPTQVGQVVMNLGTNAAHALGGGTGIMEISLENVYIHHDHEDRFRVPDEGKYVKLKVSDTGCGMTEKVLFRVFDPYFTTKNENEGTGMGLAVVHGIIENHDGPLVVLLRFEYVANGAKQHGDAGQPLLAIDYLDGVILRAINHYGTQEVVLLRLAHGQADVRPQIFSSIVPPVEAALIGGNPEYTGSTEQLFDRAQLGFQYSVGHRVYPPDPIPSVQQTGWCSSVRRLAMRVSPRW